MPSIETIHAWVIAGALIVYAVLGGADYGGGMWDLLASGPRRDRQRALIADTIGPVWEANHVWLIVAVVILFTAYPGGFAAIMTALHIPVSLMLVGIVLRGSSFVFRKYDLHDDAVLERWGRVFGIASLLTPFFLGITLGATASGDVRFAKGTLTSGFFSGWTTPFALVCGLFAQGLFAYVAAVFLTIDAHDDTALRDDFRRRALAAGVALLPLAAVVFWIAHLDAGVFAAGFAGWWVAPVVITTAVAAVVGLVGLATRRFHLARAAAVAQVALVILGWGLAQYPYVVVPDVTFHATVAPLRTLVILAWALAIGGLLVVPAFGYLFYIFRGRRKASA